MQETAGRLSGDLDDETSPDPPRIAEEASIIRIPLLAEELTAEKTVVSLGSVHLHKGVTSEEKTLSIPIFHEEVTVEHLTPEMFDKATAGDDPEVLIIPIYEEQVVIEKRMVLKEYIRVRKYRVEEEHIARQTVRREYVEVVSPEDVRSASALDGPTV